MTKRNVVGFSLYPEDIENLNKLAEAVGVSKSELLRRMIWKVTIDEKEQAILRRGYLTTSNNVHYGYPNPEAENKRPGHDSGSDSSSLESTNNILDRIEELKKKHLHLIARYNWLEPSESLNKEINEVSEEINKLETLLNLKKAYQWQKTKF